MGAQGFAPKAKDTIKSHLMSLRNRYEDICDAPDAHGNRFRVRAEILLSGEEYYTVEIGCVVQGVLNLPWAEYGSADLEIRFGSQIDRARSIKTMVRRSSDRLGREINIADALLLEGTDASRRLLMSNKEYSKLPAAERLGAKLPQSSAGVLGFNAQRAVNASAQMQQQLHHSLNQQGGVPLNPPDVPGHQNWAEETSAQATLRQSAAAPPPPTQQRGGQASGDAHASTTHVPVPSGPERRAPLPSSSGGRNNPSPPGNPGGRVAPPPSTAHG